MQQSSTRAGRYVLQPTDYRAFVPAPLPPVPRLEMDDEILDLLSRADRALGRLDGSADSLPNPDLFVMMYVRKEALLSSQIEGTQASLAEVLEMEAKVFDPDHPSDAMEVVNYVAAMNYGLERLNSFPMSLRLVREIHAKLLAGTRGQERNPGESRTSQNWIGPAGCNLGAASFVPPAPDDMRAALGDLESFLHDERPTPLLIKIGLTHAQFETIHPFLDGNGRVGRLIITFLLCQQEVLKRPLLYLSYYFKQNRAEYYDRLQAVRGKGDWEGWIKFFLRGVSEVSNEATAVARRIIALREEDRAKILAEAGRSTAEALKLYEQLFEHPMISISKVQKATGKAFPAANRLVTQMEQWGILKEISGRSRRRVYLHERYFQLFEDVELGRNIAT